MSNPIKLTLENGDKILLKVFAVKESDSGSIVVFSTNANDEMAVKESLEEIEALMLRDQFAMSAMNGYLASTPLTTRQNISIGSLASDSYDIADAMIEARKEGV